MKKIHTKKCEKAEKYLWKDMQKRIKNRGKGGEASVHKMKEKEIDRMTVRKIERRKVNRQTKRRRYNEKAHTFKLDIKWGKNKEVNKERMRGKPSHLQRDTDRQAKRRAGERNPGRPLGNRGEVAGGTPASTVGVRG